MGEIKDAFGRTGMNARLKRKLEQSGKGAQPWHSYAYHQYFEDYTEYWVAGKNGRKKIVRRYTGPVYRQAVSQAGYVLLRLAYVLLYAVLVYVLVSVGRNPRASDSTWYIALAELGTIVFLSFLGFNLLANYVFIPRNMTTGEYSSSARGLRFKACGTAVCFALDALCTLVYIPLHTSAARAEDWIACGKFLIGAALAALMFLLERSLPYEKTREKVRDERGDGVEIVY